MNIFANQFTKEEWINYQRKNTLDLFLFHEYGYLVKECEDKLTYSILKRRENEKLIIEKIEMKYKNHPMYFYIYSPKFRMEKLKSFITIIHPSRDIGEDFINDYKKIEDFCPIEDIINRGFSLITLCVGSVSNDDLNGKKSGIFKEMNIQETDSSMGGLQSWAWACSKVLDYLTSRKEFDENKVAVVGHSRGGKTALLAGAMDERFYLSISNCSGNSGAALSRGNKGETIKDIVTRFPYWFNNNYKKYIDNEVDLPFDQHQLIGLIAPRKVYIASASEDSWADPQGELMACRLASQYFNLYEEQGLVIPSSIKNDVSYNQGHIAYHCKTGEHTLEKRDWHMFMDYFY